MGVLLERLAEKRDDLLLAEVAALLHQMAKCSSGFIQSHLRGGQPFPNFHPVPPSELDETFVESSILSKWKSGNETNLWSFLTPDQKTAIKRMPSFKPLPTDEEYQVYQILATWHRKDRDKGKNLPFTGRFQWIVDRTGYPVWLLDACHGAAHVEKVNVSDGEPDAIGLTNPFGSKWVLLGSTDENKYGKPQIDLDTQIKSFDFGAIVLSPKGWRNHIVSEGRRLFTKTVAETTAPVNEVSLYEWHWSTAALYKSMLAAIEMGAVSIPYPTHQAGLRWRTLRVTVDVLGLFRKAHRIADVLGYQTAIGAFFNKIKKLIEVTYPLGNEIYRDTTGIYFTFPDADDATCKALLNELEPKIREKLESSAAEIAPVIEVGNESWGELCYPEPKWSLARHMLAEPRKASILTIQRGETAMRLQPPDFWPAGDKVEICPVCGLRPLNTRSSAYREERCEDCKQRASRALQIWKTCERFQGNPLERETIWLDEIADEHDRVALVVGRFHLDHWLDGTLIRTLYAGKNKDGDDQFKEPSPARIMRIWSTAQEFWEITIKQQFKDYYQQSQNRHQRYRATVTWDANKSPTPQEYLLDGTAGGFPVSLLREHGQEWSIVINPALAGIEPNRPAKTVPLSVRQENGNWHTGILTITNQATPYQPTRTILTSPDQFLALVPAADALAIANAIAKRYGEEFGKVRSRLPLDLALVYFHRKMPLYAVIDAARRFLTEPSPSEKPWTVKDVTRDHHAQRAKLRFDNGVEWDVSTCFGDGSEDNFYPYIGLWDTNAQGDYRANGRGYVHVKHVADKEVAVAPSRFSYLWLDTSTRRYAIGEREDEAPFVTQGMYLEEIAQLIEMWETLQKHHDGKRQITDSTLHGVIELLLEKQQSWKAKAEDELFARFATDVLARSGLAKIGITTADVTSGRLFRCFDLHYRIMKQRLAPQKQPAETTQHQSDEKEIAHQ